MRSHIRGFFLSPRFLFFSGGARAPRAPAGGGTRWRGAGTPQRPLITYRRRARTHGPSVGVSTGWLRTVTPKRSLITYGRRATTSSPRMTTHSRHRPGAVASSHHGCSNIECVVGIAPFAATGIAGSLLIAD